MIDTINRTDRFSALIRKEIATVLLKAKDQRVKLITITNAIVSADLSHAKIYFTTRADQNVKEALLVLKKNDAFFTQQNS